MKLLVVTHDGERDVRMLVVWFKKERRVLKKKRE
jgi:hypothetical protein